MDNLSALQGYGIQELIKIALAEDAPSGDVTARCAISQAHYSHARVIAREELCFCGELFIPHLIKEFGSAVSAVDILKDGTFVNAETILLKLSGPTRALLQLERTLLNFLQRLSGVATKTHEIVSNAHGITILDTRKTIPGWRHLDKYAVRVGGAKNHRFSLSDMIMIKNNHIDANAGDIEKTLNSVKQQKPYYMPVQVEVRTLQELEKVLPFKPDAVLLDNMKNSEIKDCIDFLKTAAPMVKIEISGGITIDRLAALAEILVPAVSLGALTGAARNRDISLRIEP
jgi:nicotinate-nucleotide pyrophosphorylase (carboxylating)